mgnify:FL=1
MAELCYWIGVAYTAYRGLMRPHTGVGSLDFTLHLLFVAVFAVAWPILTIDLLFEARLAN